VPLWITAGGSINPWSETIVCKKLPRQRLKSYLIANDIQCLQMRIKTDVKNCQIERFFAVWRLCWNNQILLLRHSTLREISKRKRDMCRTCGSGNEKRKIKAAKESEIKDVSGATKKFVGRKNSTVPRSRNQVPSHSVPWKIEVCTVFLYLLCTLRNKFHRRLPWASSVIQIPRGKTTDLMLALSKTVRTLRLDPNVFQQLRFSNPERST